METATGLAGSARVGAVRSHVSCFKNPDAEHLSEGRGQAVCRTDPKYETRASATGSGATIGAK
jgi:hypothetical protein